MIKTAIFSVILLFSIQFAANAQETMIGSVNYPLLEKYVELAKKYYPRRQMFKANEQSAKAKIGIASASYLESLNVSYFYRPDNAAIVDSSNPYSINGFQFGVYLNLGVLLRTPSLVKQAKEDYKATIFQSKEYDIILESEVKQKYFEYLRFFNDLKVRTQAFSDNKTASDGMRYKFEKGEVSLDDYSKAKALTSNSNSEKLLAEVNLLKAKDALESLIGQKLEEVKLDGVK